MHSLNRIFAFAFFCAFVSLSSDTGWAAPVVDELQLELRTDATVSGNHVALADLLVVESDNPKLKDTVESLRVASAPRVGNIERYTREDLEQLIRSRLMPFSGKMEWRGAKVVKVRSVGQVLEGDRLSTEVKEAVKKELQARFVDVELNTSAPLPDVELPAGDVSWKLRPIDMNHLSALLPVWLDVSVNHQPYRAVAISFALKLSAQVLIIRRDLQIGTMVSAADFETKLQDVSGISQDVLPVADLETPVRVKVPLRKGQILMRGQLSPQGMVFRGDSVRLMLADGGLTIETRAVAEQDGTIGQFVKVRPEAGVAELTGLIVAAGLVKVEGK